MVPKPVEAVFVVFYGPAAHRATYGRLSGGRYTKDYIQLIRDSEFRGALERFFPRNGTDEKKVNIEYRWPGGSCPGFVDFNSADRPHLAWETSKAPLPWKMTPYPSESSPETIHGDSSATEEADADAQLAELSAEGIQPYLVAVKLKDEHYVLHVRSYITEPPHAFAFANTARLPAKVQVMVGSVTRSRAFTWASFDSGGAIMAPEIAGAVERLAENPALLLVGPPGTGKTVLLESLVDFVENPGRGILFDPDKNHDAWVELTEQVPGKARNVVLHPAYSYDNLVLGLLPKPMENGGVGIKVTTGPLVNLAHYASVPGRRALLVLDEFNRANAAAVLGDTLALLDKRGTAHVDLPYGDLDIEVPDEFAANGSRKVASRFTLPPNLWIVAAMNTSDRSVAPLDAALRRRFTIVEMAPDYDVLLRQLAADIEADLTAHLTEWTIGHVGKLAVKLLRALNRRIDMVLGPDFRLGQSNFWRVSGENSNETLQSLAAAFDHRIVQNLRLSLQDDDSALAAILRAGTPEQPLGDRATSAARWKRPDPDLASFASDRLHLRELSSLSLAEAVAELRRQAED